jgi:Flp pilus assembly pilin Flp
MGRTVTSLKKFLRGRGGEAAAEYAVILAVIASSLTLSASVLGQSIADSIFNTSELLLDQRGCNNNGHGTGFGGGNGSGQGQGAGRGLSNSC